MSPGQALFRSELSAAVRDAQPPPADRPRTSVVSPPRSKPAKIRLWLPLTPLWVLLAPFALIASPLLLCFRETRGAPPLRTAFATGAALFALSGTDIHVEAPGALVRIKII